MSGYMKDVANQPNRQTFPGATFEIAGEVPQAQCSEAVIEGENAFIIPGTSALHDPGAFTGHNLIGKFVTILPPAADAGTYQIAANTDDVVNRNPPFFLGGDPVAYYIHNGGSLIDTRDIASFAAYLSENGIPFTIKGGKIYTSATAEQLQPACSILFDPLT